MLDGLEATLYVSKPLKETYKNCKIPTKVHTDIMSLQDALQSSKYITDKRLRINTGALKEVIFNKEIESIRWIKSAQIIANSLK